MPEDLWTKRDDAGNLIEKFKYIELEFLFNTDDEATHISELIANIVEEFNTRITNAEVIWERDDPIDPKEGGVALYDIFPNQPGLLEAFQERLNSFDVEITIWPTKGE